MVRWIVLCLALAGPVCADGLSGVVRVVDGDTFDVGAVRVRLHGIDAPEEDQRCAAPDGPMWACGAWVSDAVRARFGGRRADCEVVDTDRYGRAVARCVVGGEDVGQVLVREGLAFAYRKYSWDYDLDEKAAVIAGLGLHGMEVARPEDYRAAGRKGRAAQTPVGAPEGCAIKGNISGKGKRIYHMPGQTWYAGTKIDAAKGERWFCSEAEARAAGWRRAHR